MKVKRNITGIIVVATMMVLGFVGVVSALAEQPPNLTPFSAADMRLETKIDGSVHLRFSTTSWNKGIGPLELVAGVVDIVNGKQKVFQRIYSDDGSYKDTLAGSFVWHEGHGHFHFDDYALYTLQPVNAPGASDRTSAKTTFCIIDTTRVNTRLPGAPKHAKYRTCSSSVQGMSVGWGDRYGYSLEGQSIDITGLPNGDYNLKIEVDPKKRIIESNEDDNISNVLIRITNGTVTVIQ